MKGSHVAFVVVACGVLGGALAAFLSLQVAQRRVARDERPAGPPAGAPAAPTASPPPAELPPPAASGPDADLGDWRRSAQPGEDREKLAALPTEIDYPRFEKYAGASFSAVPHRLVAAWDDRPDDAAFGPRRMFIAVVDPSIDDASLETLLRDMRDRHRDAEILGVRVFDSLEAARRPSWTDQGRSRDAHLVAELRRDAVHGRETLRVRGREIEP